MQVSRLKMIAEECRRDLNDEGASEVEGFYRHKSTWWGAKDGNEVEAHLRSEFDWCLGIEKPYRTKNSHSSNFPLVEIQAVIRAKFNAALRYPRSDAIQRVVLRSYRNASNAFAVRFNPMTGLLGKAAFHETVSERLATMGAFGPTPEELKSDEASLPAMCLLALDIDHFKQVNDTYGHAYGDLVIRSFAVRIDRAVKAFCCGSASKLEGVCAHVSGEEFFCLAWGSATGAEFDNLAASILGAIRDRSLPSDEDLELLKSTFSPAQLVIPHATSRNITCSIGGIVSGVPTAQDSSGLANRLIAQADQALYKSKSQGRNRVTFFPSILESGGRVLEHKKDVAICIIDIGEEVGVIKGQEFIVLHPEFTGATPYIVDDGRSRKVLGMLPKSPLCAITAFDVQRQISFCRLSEERFIGVEIPRNSVLEAIPLGTLSVPVVGPVIIASGDDLLEKVASVSDTQHYLSGEIVPGGKRSFAVVRIRNEAQLLSEYGPGAVNRGLATVCRNLRKVKEVEFLGQIEPTQLLLQFSSFGMSQQQELDSVLDQAERDTGQRVRFVAGVYPGRFLQQKHKWLADKKIPEIVEVRSRVDLARYAASHEGADEGARIELFTYRTAWWILVRLRESRELKRGLADYQRFTQLGIVGPELDNAAGQLASASGDLARAEELYLKAAAGGADSEITYKLNALTVQMRQGNPAAAAVTADSIGDIDLEKGYARFPTGIAYLALAMTARWINSGSNEDKLRALKWSERALNLKITENLRKSLIEAGAKLTGGQENQLLVTAVE